MNDDKNGRDEGGKSRSTCKTLPVGVVAIESILTTNTPIDETVSGPFGYGTTPV